MTHSPIYLAIDPGKDALGWALGGGRLLLMCGMSRRPRDFAGGLGALAQLHAKNVRDGICQISPDVIVVELMQSYAFGSQKGDQNDLLELCTIGAQAAGQWPGAEHRYVRPAEWKGQTPKEISAARTEKELSKRGCLETLNVARFPKTLRHNVYDAVGIWIYATKDLK